MFMINRCVNLHEFIFRHAFYGANAIKMIIKFVVPQIISFWGAKDFLKALDLVFYISKGGRVGSEFLNKYLKYVRFEIF